MNFIQIMTRPFEVPLTSSLCRNLYFVSKSHTSFNSARLQFMIGCHGWSIRSSVLARSILGLRLSSNSSNRNQSQPLLSSSIWNFELIAFPLIAKFLITLNEASSVRPASHGEGVMKLEMENMCPISPFPPSTSKINTDFTLLHIQIDFSKNLAKSLIRLSG